ncbi:MAG: hypothetical protein ACTHK0_06130 [Ginsengibacter sp.]
MPVNTGDQARLALLQKYPLVGHCQGRFAFCSAASDFLQSLLPDDLVLAPQEYTPEGQHPLLLMFNNTWLKSNPNLRRIAVASDAALNLNYFEFIVMLPYVQFKEPQYNSRAPYCYLPILYLNSLLAVMGGRIFWEFNKQMAGFSVKPLLFFVMEENAGTPLLSGATPIMGILQPNTTIPNFQTITPILQLPVIEHGPYGYVSSIYKIFFENIDIAPAAIEVSNSACQFMPSGLINSPAITENPLGSFQMNYNWKLSYIEFIKF